MSKAEIIHLLDGLLTSVHWQIVQVDADLFVRVLESHLLKVVFKFRNVDGVLEDLVVLLASLLRDTRQQAQGRLLQLILVDPNIFVW